MKRHTPKSSAAPSAAPGPDRISKEFATVAGKYRVRVLTSAATGYPTLDIREYVKAATFEGFTRRGIRLATFDDVRTLRDALTAILDEQLLDPHRVAGADPIDLKKCTRCGRNNPAQTKDLCQVCEDEAGDGFASGASDDDERRGE